MWKILANRFEQGCRTLDYPQKEVTLDRSYRGRPIVNKQCEAATARRCAELCPQRAIDATEKTIDLGKCTFCGRCQEVGPEAFVSFTQDFALATASRQGLITDGSLPLLAGQASSHFRKLFGRSLQLRQVSAGGCNSCETDTNVLNTPVFDLSRFGIDFVASPRHADGLHVTGPITRNMRAALLATYEAVPAPKVVIAAGCCAISGGPFYGSDEIVGDLSSLLPVDLYIPGCPPHPLTTLHALINFFH
jgi:Ni,Fe-hydrogenase III small subunit